MATLAEIRQQHPEYNDLSDAQLADGLYRKFYSDMPRAQFDAKVGLKASGPDFSQATDTGNNSDVQAAYARANPLEASGGTALAADAGAGDFLKTAGSNLLPSAMRFGGDIVNAVSHPIETVKNIANVGMGGVEKLIPGQQAHEPYADAVGKFFMDRYGGIDNIKKTMAEDPVGFLGDLSTVLGIGAAARAPGIAGEVSRVAGTVGRVIDPINAGLKAAKVIGKGVGKVAETAGGLSTGAGGTALRTAAKVGFEGGDAAKTFRDNMRGNVPMEDVIAQAKSGLDAIKQERQAAYSAGMADLSKDQTVLDFSKIDQALAATKPVKSFKGVSLQPSATETAGQIAEVLDQWRKLPPADFHTPEGLDALKQRIYDLRDGVKPGSASEKLVTQVYNIVKDQIVKQAPEYAKTMEGYQKASELIKEIEGTLSLNRNARIDTKLRKLQSIMRNNVNTNYGKRADLVKLLQEKGATNIMSALAGQALNSFEPRGLARVLAAPAATAGGVGAAFVNPLLAVPAIGGALSASPRLMGEAAHAAGRGARAVRHIPVRGLLQGAYQAERDVPPWQRIRPGQPLFQSR